MSQQTTSSGPSFALVASVGLALFGCDPAAEHGPVAGGADCSCCHGSAANAAPPGALSGASATDAVEVGAHQAHLVDGSYRAAVACGECHVVPWSATDPGHLDAWPAEVTWGALARASGAAPSWERAEATCAGSYCHGATLAGGTTTSPVWTEVDGSQTGCGSCHGAPPPPPHPDRDACEDCHAETMDGSSGTIDIAGARHVNGVVDVTPDCSSCHGSAGHPAPPTSVGGLTDTTAVEVGAHASHLRDGAIRRAVLCQECHRVPTSADEPTHRDAAPAELEWGVLAQAHAVAPSWDRALATCAATYCHGATLTGGTNTAPQWTLVDGSQAACGTCHGAPPPGPHPQNDACETCHPGTMDGTTGTIDVAAGLHIDGLLQVATNGPCDGCHGAPPASGSHLVHFAALPTSASYGGVGATAELLPAGTAYAFDCGNCHPLDLARHANGVDNAGGGQAEVELSPAGAAPGSLRAMHLGTASYQPGATVAVDADGLRYTEGGTCSDVYCHSAAGVDAPGPVPEPGVDLPFAGYPIQYPSYGVTLARTYRTPSWGDTLSCGGCHGFPPRTASPEVAAGVGDSHSYIDAGGNENLHGWLHGAEPMACTGCHAATVTAEGTRTRSTAPATYGWSVYSPVPIADHARHVDGERTVAFTTAPVPMLTTGFDLGSASYDPGTRSCSDVSCHLAAVAVTWGAPYRFENPFECNSCHQK
ncbi:MAG: CxxxxCH/CxxCH domain-containing protein [Polyangiaceae bacterium]|nr:CxxxxCH/CxxCH domain-containing protein [Polyangiaceae bacterium]